jgi:1,4-alpha-glucan branching enzyme
MKTQLPSKSPKPQKSARAALRPAKKGARFILACPSARHVFLAGDFNAWNAAATPLVPDGQGGWATELELPPGRHEYLFVIDGHWEVDPSAESVPNPFGGTNSVITIESGSARRIS